MAETILFISVEFFFFILWKLFLDLELFGQYKVQNNSIYLGKNLL